MTVEHAQERSVIDPGELGLTAGPQLARPGQGRQLGLGLAQLGAALGLGERFESQRQGQRQLGLAFPCVEQLTGRPQGVGRRLIPAGGAREARGDQAGIGGLGRRARRGQRLGARPPVSRAIPPPAVELVGPGRGARD